MNRRKNNNRKGFTLLELMIVVVILGLLATIIVPKILHKPDQARCTKAKVDISQIQQALGYFHLDTHRFPMTSEGLTALVTNPGIEKYDPDGYLDNVPVDPWGNAYIYISPAKDKDYLLKSYGRDGEEGGSGYDADIDCWNLQDNK